MSLFSEERKKINIHLPWRQQFIKDTCKYLIIKRNGYSDSPLYKVLGGCKLINGLYLTMPDTVLQNERRGCTAKKQREQSHKAISLSLLFPPRLCVTFFNLSFPFLPSSKNFVPLVQHHC